MKTFEIIRNYDETGVSGTGKVLEGVIMTSGICIIQWTTNNGKPNSIVIFNSFEDFKEIHIQPHPINKTEILWHEK